MRRPLLPSTVLVLVTAVLVPYGSHAWAWVAGPVSALVVWGLDRAAHKPMEPALAPVKPTGIISSAPRRPEP